MSGLKVGIVGCAGRMGRMLAAEVAATEGCALAGGIEAPGHEAVGADLGRLAGLDALGIAVGDDAPTLFADCEAVIDFTTPALVAENSRLAAQGKTIYVLGTTGLDAAQEKALELAARHTAIIRAPNMSLGVNVLIDLVERLAGQLDESFDIEIVEMHHRHKVDAPSGTALALGEAAARGRGVALDEVAQHARQGHTGARRRGDIGFAVLRGGDVPGDHTVVFAADGERIELTHRAGGRHIFARGAVKAALWGRGRPPGIYSLRDVLAG